MPKKLPKRMPKMVMWRGLGLLSPRGLFLEAYGEVDEHVLNRLLAGSPAGSRLVVVAARLEPVTVRKVREMGEVELGIASPPRSRKGRSS